MVSSPNDRRGCHLHPDTGFTVLAVDLDGVICTRCRVGAAPDPGTVAAQRMASAPVSSNPEMVELIGIERDRQGSPLSRSKYLCLLCLPFETLRENLGTLLVENDAEL